MPTLKQLRDKADAWLTPRWTIMVDRQETYRAAHGRYWQGLIFHTVIPEATTTKWGDLIPDRLTVKPSDQAENWLDFLPELEGIAVAAALWVDVYDGPQGHGFVANLAARYNGTLYHRAQNRGPETWRTQDWHVVNEDSETAP